MSQQHYLKTSKLVVQVQLQELPAGNTGQRKYSGKGDSNLPL